MRRSATIHGAGITPADAIASAGEYRDLIHPGWEVVTDMEVAPITGSVGRWFHAQATVAGDCESHGEVFAKPVEPREPHGCSSATPKSQEAV